MTPIPCYLDLCAFHADPSQWGVVFATPSDYEAMYALREDPHQDMVQVDPSIEPTIRDAFRNSLDYAPPRDTIVVWFPPLAHYKLVPNKLVKVVSRRFFIGEPVIRKDRPNQTGIVLTTKSTACLQTVSHIAVCPYPEALLCLRTGIMDTLVPNIEVSDLEGAIPMQIGDAILLKGWAGVAKEILTEKTMRLFNGTSVVLPPQVKLLLKGSPHEMEAHEPGRLVTARKADLRNGRWIEGQYDANVDPIGVLIKIRPVTIKVDWQHHYSDRSKFQVNMGLLPPPDFLTLNELESPDFFHYNLEWCLGRDPAHDGYCGPQSAPLLRFADVEAARAKYGGRPHAYKLFNHSELDVSNIFQLASSTSSVMVQWQDSNITTEPSTELLKAESAEHNELFPGTIVRTVDLKGLDENPTAGFADAPQRVGVVQSVSSDCFAKVRWFESPQVFLDQKHDYVTEDGYRCGRLLDEVEDVSTYDITIPGGLDFVRLDFVRLRQCSDASSMADRTWIGHIIEVHSDATYTVRLGAAKEPRNVRLHVDEIDFVLDPDDEADDHGSAHGDDQHMDDLDSSMIDELSDGSEEDFGRILMGDRTETIDIIMEGNASPRSYHSGTENADAWSTASEGTMGHENVPIDGDDAMGDWPQMGDNVALPDQQVCNAPALAQYILHDGTVPGYHKYATEAGQLSGPGLRKVMKEHTILSEESAIPSGIYIQSWEGSCNTFRALILGPSETPYAHCPFVFDVLLPASYPNKPPTVFFYHWQTKHQRRINPNLYENGYVCLSLLNTWPGEASEGWMPGKSTLLQALISIQSLILVPEPYYNEPGFEAKRETPGTESSSVAYSEQSLLQSRGFLLFALSESHTSLKGIEPPLAHLYINTDGPRLLQRIIREDRILIERSRAAPADASLRDGLRIISKGACIGLERIVESLELIAASLAEGGTDLYPRSEDVP